MNNEQISLPAEIEAATERIGHIIRHTISYNDHDGFVGEEECARQILFALSHTTPAQPDRDLVERMLEACKDRLLDPKRDISFGKFHPKLLRPFEAAQACAKVAEQRINAIKAEYEQQISNLLAQARETQFGRFEP